MAVRLLYFAWVRERTGVASETVELPAGLATVADVMGWLESRGPNFAAAFERMRRDPDRRQPDACAAFHELLPAPKRSRFFHPSRAADRDIVP